MGVINGQNWIYVDGVKVQETGADDYWSNSSVMTRTVELPPAQATPGEHVIAMRIQGPADGRILGIRLAPASPSPCDPGRSAGKHQHRLCCRRHRLVSTTLHAARIG